MKESELGTALITDASSGIGTRYAERLARRGYDLVLVARNGAYLLELAARLQGETDSIVRAISADFTDAADLACIETLLSEDCRITMLVNKVGIDVSAQLLDSDIDRMQRMIDLNVTALTRLTYAAAPGFAARGTGTIVNIVSLSGIASGFLNCVYGASKAYVLALNYALHRELAGKGVRVQAVLPSSVAPDLGSDAGTSPGSLPKNVMMSADDMVDAALAGLDQGELVTIPVLGEGASFDAYEAARLAVF